MIIFEFLKLLINIFGMKMADFEGHYVMNFFHLRAPYFIFGLLEYKNLNNTVK